MLLKDEHLMFRREFLIVPKMIQYVGSGNHFGRVNRMAFWLTPGVKCPSAVLCVPFQVIVKGVETALIMKLFHQFSVYLRWKHSFIHTIRYKIQIRNDTMLTLVIAVHLLPAKLIRIAI